MILIIYRYISGLRQTQSQIPERLLDKHGSQAPDPQFQEKYFFILVLQYIAGCLFVLLLIFSALKKISISPYPGEGLTGGSIPKEQRYALPSLLSSPPPALPHPRFHRRSSLCTEKNGDLPESLLPVPPDTVLQTEYPDWL